MSGGTLVTGGGGLLGYALRQRDPAATYVTRKDCDLTDLGQVRRLFARLAPARVIHLAAQVGGVKRNAEQNADLLTMNAQINANVLSVAQEQGVARLISVLSSCVFPELPDRPATEDDVHAGMPFEGNLGYGYSKRMLDLHTRLLWRQYGCRYSTITPVTMYGPNDNWDLDGGHVVGSLIHKCYVAKEQGRPLEVWGSGAAIRQFVYAGDIARLLLQAMDAYDGPETVIIAPDAGVTIRTLVACIVKAMRFDGPVVFDRGQPEGQLVKVIRSLTFARRFPGFVFTSLEEGLNATVEWFMDHHPAPAAGHPARHA